MKKVLAVLAVSAIFTGVCTGCGDVSNGIDKKLADTWYSEELEGNLEFGKDGKVSMIADYDVMGMYFTEDKFVMDDMEIDFDFDGKQISVDAGEAFGLDESLVFIEMEKSKDDGKDKLDGEYKLTGGALYEGLESQVGDEATETYMIINGDQLDIKIGICDYKADGKKITFTGSGVTFLNLSDGEEAVCDYKIEGENLSITEKDEETGEDVTLEFTKAK